MSHGPDPRDPAPFRIGIPVPASVPAAASTPTPSVAATASADVIRFEPPEPVWTSWTRYCDWRMTKCPNLYADPLDVVAHATLELVGELSELSELVLDSGGIGLILTDEGRSRIVDEAGDCFFCAAWAMDAWGFNILRADSRTPDDSLLDERALGPLRTLQDEARAILPHAAADWPSVPFRDDQVQYLGRFEILALNNLAQAMLDAGLTADAAKKRRYQQRRDVDPRTQSERIFSALCSVQRLLTLAGRTVSDALEHNVAKLDARFPHGWTPGGGIR